MAGREQLKVYVVRRLNWEYGDDFWYREEAGDAPVETFLDRTKAEARRRQLEWQHVQEARINPFGYIDADLEGRTSLPPEEFFLRLRRAGLRLGGEDGWRSYLWSQYDELSDEQRRLVWEAVDGIRFFEVVEMTVDLES
jgi:hypothetical protein